MSSLTADHYFWCSGGVPCCFEGVRGIMGCSRGVPGLFQAVLGCSGGVPGMFWCSVAETLDIYQLFYEGALDIGYIQRGVGYIFHCN